MTDVANVPHDLLVTGEQAAEILDISIATLWRRKQEGKLPKTVLKGKREMFRLGDLIELKQEISSFREATVIPNHTVASLLLCTFRYSLGRMTYITSECESWLRQYWHVMPFGWRTQIHNDIRHAIEHGIAGHKCDIENWKKILELPLGEES